MSWKKVKLGEVITHRKEFITISDSVEYKRCRVQVNRKGIVLRDLVKGIQINTKKQQVCKEGDFLVAEIDAKVGGYGFVPAGLEGAIVSSHYFLFEVDETKMLKGYLAWIIKTDIIQEQISSKGSTNYAAIRPSHVLNFEIPLPPVIEQKRLVKKLNSFYQSYEMIQIEISQQENYLKLLRQSILQEAIQGKLVPQDANEEPAEQLLQRIKAEKAQLVKEGKLRKEKELPPITEEEIPFELPKGWVWCRLENATLNIHYGFNASSNEKINDVKLLRITDIQENNVIWQTVPGCIISEKEYNTYKLNENDILIARTGGTIGKSYIVKKLSVNAVFASYLIRVIPSTLVNPDFLKLFIESPIYWKQLTELSSGTGQPNVNGTSLKSLFTPLPPFLEQQQIVNKVQQLLQRISELEKQVLQSKEQSQQLLQTILREAFTGGQKEYAENEMLTMAAEE